MRKFALLSLVVVALAAPGIAAAATPQGKLTGSATFGALGTLTISTTNPVIDGGTDFVGLENDKSGNCAGDSGTVIVSGVFTLNVVCAHFIASSGCCNTGNPKMRFAYQTLSNYVVARVTDNGGNNTDTFARGTTDTLAHARAWVNKGAIGGLGISWPSGPPSVVTMGNYTVTAAQTP